MRSPADNSAVMRYSLLASHLSLVTTTFRANQTSHSGISKLQFLVDGDFWHEVRNDIDIVASAVVAAIGGPASR